MRGSIISAVLAIAGCGADVARVDLPATTGGASLLIAYEERGQVRLHAYAIGDDAPALSFDVQSLSEYGAYALVYEDGLERLGLAAGPIEVVRDEPQKPLEPALREWAMTKDADGRPLAWALAEARPSWLAAVRIRGTPSPCARFAARDLTALPAAELSNEWGFAVKRGDKVLAGTDFGELFEIGADATSRLIDGPMIELMRSTAAALDDQGGIWIGDAFGRIWHGQLAEDPSTWTLASALTPVARIDFMDVAPDGSELVVLARDGAVATYRTDLDRWRVVHRLAVELDSTARKGGVVWLAPGELLAGGPFSRTVAHITDGVVVEEPVPAMSGMTSLQRLETGALIAGSGSGEVFERVRGQWSALPDSGSGFWVLCVTAFREGFVFGSPYGAFGQYAREDYVCPLETPVAFTIRYIARLDEHLVLLGESLANPAPRGIVLSPR